MVHLYHVLHKNMNYNIKNRILSSTVDWDSTEQKGGIVSAG